MYDVSQVLAAFSDLIGWRQGVDPNSWQLTALLNSTSGLWYNDVHAMVTIENLMSVADQFAQIHQGNEAARDAAFTQWVRERTDAGITQTLNDWINEKSLNQTSGNLLSDDELFESTGNIADKEAAIDKVVGLEIIPSRSKSMVLNLKEIGLQFDTAQTININLFQAGQSAPVQTKSIVYSAANSVQWEPLDWQLSQGKVYWLGYDQGAISGMAINGVRDYNYLNGGLTSFPTGRFYQATAFNVDTVFGALWDLKQNAYTISTNYGLNLKLSVECDYTQFIINHKKLFQTAVWLRVGMNMLKEIQFNSNARANRNEANLSVNSLSFEIEGDTQGQDDFSLYRRYKKALSAIHFDRSSIDKICLPCKKRSVNWKSVGASGGYNGYYS